MTLELRRVRLIAVIATGLASLASGAAAQQLSNAPAPTPVADRWAVVQSDGTLARHKGALSSAVLGRGIYEVGFKNSVASCAYQATLGNSGAGNPPLGLVSVAPRLRAPSKVLVVTRTPSGTPAPAGFHLFVSCPDAPAGAQEIATRLAADDRWAVVDYDGTLSRNRGAVSSALVPPSTGEAYEVIFDKDVTECAYFASHVFGYALEDPEIYFGVARRGRNPDGVYVRPPFGVAAGFSLVAKCPAPAAQAAAQRTHSADRWAVVNANGTIARGFGAVSADNYATGRYEVRLARGTLADWPPSAHLVTIGTASASSVLPLAGTALGFNWYTTRNHVVIAIATRDASGALANRPFHLYVVGR